MGKDCRNETESTHTAADLKPSGRVKNFERLLRDIFGIF